MPVAKKELPLVVDLPRPGEDRPVWSRVGLIAAAGFAIGILWPRLAGLTIGPSAPEDAKAKAEAAAAPPSSASAGPSSAAPPASEAQAPAPEPGPAAAPAAKQTVVIGAGSILRCWDDKNKKVEECGELQLDPVAKKKLATLAECPAALGLEGKVVVSFDVDFKKKEVHVSKGKKNTLPTSTIDGVVQCAAKELAKVDLGEVPHKLRRYTVAYTLTFYPPGKQPEAEPEGAAPTEPDAKGATTDETSATGSATVSWDTALVRKTPKDGDIVARVVRGTRVKIVAKQNDWYRVEVSGKTGWVYRGAIGL